MLAKRKSPPNFVNCRNCRVSVIGIRRCSVTKVFCLVNDVILFRIGRAERRPSRKVWIGYFNRASRRRQSRSEPCVTSHRQISLGYHKIRLKVPIDELICQTARRITGISYVYSTTNYTAQHLPHITFPPVVYNKRESGRVVSSSSQRTITRSTVPAAGPYMHPRPIPLVKRTVHRYNDDRPSARSLGS